jgi:hypothetical protein
MAGHADFFVAEACSPQLIDRTLGLRVALEDADDGISFLIHDDTP